MTPNQFKELTPVATKRWVAAVRRLVDRRNQEPGALEGALRTATIKREAEKKRLAEVAPCA